MIMDVKILSREKTKIFFKHSLFTKIPLTYTKALAGNMQCKQKYPVILNSSKKSFEAQKIHNVYSYLQLLQENDQDTDHLIILHSGQCMLSVYRFC